MKQLDPCAFSGSDVRDHAAPTRYSTWTTGRGLIMEAPMKRTLVLAIALAVCPAGAWADDFADCNSGKADLAISGCSKLIDLKGLTKNDRAAAYTNRGLALAKKGNVDAAIADYTKAIAIDPNLAWAYYSRGEAYDPKR